LFAAASTESTRASMRELDRALELHLGRDQHAVGVDLPFGFDLHIECQVGGRTVLEAGRRIRRDGLAGDVEVGSRHEARDKPLDLDLHARAGVGRSDASADYTAGLALLRGSAKL
jgi:hypothetical protein